VFFGEITSLVQMRSRWSFSMAAYLSNIVTAAGYILLGRLTYLASQTLLTALRDNSINKFGRSHRLYKRNERLPNRANPWALVTGATDGLGLALAHELAAGGFNVIIHGRNATKLDIIRSEIESASKVHVRTLIIDAEKEPTSFNEASQAEFERKIHAAVADIPLTLLVNCIGVVGEWIALATRTPANIDHQLNMNVRFGCQLTRVLIPHLHASGPSLILNISSAAQSLGMAYCTLYAGSSAFKDSWARSLRYELRFEKMDNVEVYNQVFGMMATPSTGRGMEDVTWEAPDARTAARAALKNSVGTAYHSVYPYWGHALQQVVAGFLPASLMDHLSTQGMYVQKQRMEALAAKKA
jgi:17beta-estradiol 17-dehydrogenase / very-long-chain 3-oxoacyl-CoA reductase